MPRAAVNETRGSGQKKAQPGGCAKSTPKEEGGGDTLERGRGFIWLIVATTALTLERTIAANLMQCKIEIMPPQDRQ